VMELDRALADFGPEANPLRAQIREGTAKAIDEVWGASETDGNFAATNFAAALHNVRAREKALDALQPVTDEQKRVLGAAKSASDALGEARMQMSLALTAPVSYPLVLTVVAWVACLFCGFGLTARATFTSLVAMAVGAVAVASAVLLILSLSSPYSGLFRASSAPLEQALAVMGKE
jgi:hypothetical protein